MTETLWANLATVGENPLSIFALIAVLAAIVAIIYIRRIKFTGSMLVYLALMLAMTIILHQLRLYHFPQGGSVTLGSMVPIILVSYRYGAPVGVLMGFMCGLVVLMQDPFILHPLQVIFDYPLPYMVIGLAGLWKDHRNLSTFVAFTGRFLAHFISGVVFFSSYAPAGTSPLVYSFTVNAALMAPECLICALILKFLPVERLLSVMDRRMS